MTWATIFRHRYQSWFSIPMNSQTLVSGVVIITVLSASMLIFVLLLNSWRWYWLEVPGAFSIRRLVSSERYSTNTPSLFSSASNFGHHPAAAVDDTGPFSTSCVNGICSMNLNAPRRKFCWQFLNGNTPELLRVFQNSFERLASAATNSCSLMRWPSALRQSHPAQWLWLYIRQWKIAFPCCVLTADIHISFRTCNSRHKAAAPEIWSPAAAASIHEFPYCYVWKDVDRNQCASHLEFLYELVHRADPTFHKLTRSAFGEFIGQSQTTNASSIIWKTVIFLSLSCESLRHR